MNYSFLNVIEILFHVAVLWKVYASRTPFSRAGVLCARFHGTCESIITNGSLALYRHVALRETVDSSTTARGRPGMTRDKQPKRNGR